MKKSEMVKVRIEVPEEDWPGALVETLWAEPVGEGLFRLHNSPFYVYKLSYMDVVEGVALGNGVYDFVRVSLRGGHSTYRLLLPEPVADDALNQLLEPITSLGCTYEGADRRLICIDVPPSTDVEEVFRRLEKGENDGRWKFEEAHRGHGDLPDA